MLMPKKTNRQTDLYLPCVTEAANSCSVQAHYDGKDTVEIPLSFTAAKEQRTCYVQFIDLPLEGAACTCKPQQLSLMRSILSSRIV